MLESKFPSKARSTARPMLVTLLGVSLDAAGLLAVGLLSDAERMIAVTVGYVVISLSTVTAGARRDVLLFNTFLTLGVAILGLASYGAALVPGIAVLTVACFMAERRSSPWVEALAALLGFSAGLWLVLAVVVVDRVGS